MAEPTTETKCKENIRSQERLDVEVARKRSEDAVSFTSQSSRDSMSQIRLEIKDLRDFRTADPNVLNVTRRKPRPSTPFPPIHSSTNGFQNSPYGNTSEPFIPLSDRSDHRPTLEIVDRQRSYRVYPEDRENNFGTEDSQQDRNRNRQNKDNHSNTSTYITIRIDRTRSTNQFGASTSHAEATNTSSANRQAARHVRRGRTEDQSESNGADRKQTVRNADHTPISRDSAESPYGTHCQSPQHPSHQESVPYRNQSTSNSHQQTNAGKEVDRKADSSSRPTDSTNVSLSQESLKSFNSDLYQNTDCSSNRSIPASNSGNNSLVHQFQRYCTPSDAGSSRRGSKCPQAGKSEFCSVPDMGVSKNDKSQINRNVGTVGNELGARNELAVVERLCGRILSSSRHTERPHLKKGQDGTPSPPAGLSRGCAEVSMALDLESLTLWQIIFDCERAIKEADGKGFRTEDEASNRQCLENLDRLGTACHRLMMTLAIELVREFERDDLQIQEHNLCMNAAHLVRNICRSISEASVCPKGSIRLKTLIQISKIHVHNMRVLLELLSNHSPRGVCNPDFCETSRLFVVEAAKRLLILKKFLDQVTSTNTIHGWRGEVIHVQPISKDPSLILEEPIANREIGLAYDDSDSECSVTSQQQKSETFSGCHEDRNAANYCELKAEAISQQTCCPLPTNHQCGHVHFHLESAVCPCSSEADTVSNEDEVGTENQEASEEPSTCIDPVSNPWACSDSADSDAEGGISYDFCQQGDSSSGSGGLTPEELRICQSLLTPSTVQIIKENLHHRSTSEESLSAQTASHATSNTSEALHRFAFGEQCVQETFDVLVNRSSDTLLDDLVQLYANAPTKLLHSHMNVVFEGEPGIDGGALSREFFCLIFQALIDRTVKNRSVFEGERGHLLPSIDHVLNESRVFWVVGILVAQAANNRCHGLPGLSPAIRQFLSTGARMSSLDKISHLATIDDVTDVELKNLLEKVKQRKDLNDEEMATWQTWLEKSRFSYVMSEARTDDAVKRVLHYFVFESRMSQLVSIAEGMEELGWRPIPKGFDADVVFPPEAKISVDDFFRTVTMNEPSGQHTRECQMALGFFKKLCADLTEGKIENLRLSDLLHFVTGAPYLKSGISLSFMSPNQRVVYPQARTCTMELIIPTQHKTYEEFKTHFCQALSLGSYGFGFA